MTATTTTTAKTALAEGATPKLVDPTSKKAQTNPAFPLTVNNLDHIMRFEPAFGGNQWSTVARKDQPAGSHLCYITTHKPVPAPTWSSVQTGKQSHIEFDSALVYMNHSCAPTVEIEVFSPDDRGLYVDGRAGEVRVVKGRDLKEGDELVWFYPSTEFISPRPFECRCGAGEGACISMQRGACYVDPEFLTKHFLNQHIYELLEERDGRKLA
jgi:hypothetical protein